MGSLHVDLLGPLMARVDDRTVTLPSGRPQLVLAALVVAERGRMSLGALMECLWDEPPASASSNLRTHISALRRSLGTEAERLHREPGWVSLTLEPLSVDWTRFAAEALTQGGQALHQSVSASETRARLGSALRLWRGRAAEGLPRVGTLGLALEAMDRRRLTVLELYAEACVEDGCPAEAIDALKQALMLEPTREDAWAQLVKVHLTSGARHEAEATLDDAYRTLRSEMGAEPGEGLRSLRRAVASRREVAPQRLMTNEQARPTPGAGTTLVGRGQQLSHLERQVRRDGAIVLHGIPGVGKSALARALASRVSARHPGGHVYVDVCGNTPRVAAMSQQETAQVVLRSLSRGSQTAPTGSLAFTLAALRERVAERPPVVILDNVLDALQVRDVVDALAGACVVLTSRSPLTSLGIPGAGVEELTSGSAVDLLRLYIGADRVDAELTRAVELAQACGHLPLALRIVGLKLAARPELRLDDLADTLRDERRRLKELVCEDLEVRTGVEHVIGGLGNSPDGERAVTLLQNWALVGAPVLTRSLARALLDSSQPDADDAAHLLASAGLIEASTGRCHRVHDLIRLHALESGLGAPVETRQQLVTRARSYIIDSARRARETFRPDPYRHDDEFTRTWGAAPVETSEDAFAWYEMELQNALALARKAGDEVSLEADRFVARLPVAFYPFLPMNGHYRDLLELSQLAVVAARRQALHLDLAAALTTRSVAHSRLGAHDLAVAGLREAMALRRAHGTPGHVSVTMVHLATLLAGADRLPEARSWFEQALALQRTHAAPGDLGVCLNNLSDVLLRMGLARSALPHLDESLAIRESIGDQLGIGVTSLTIAQAHLSLGDEQAARVWADRALTLARSSSNREAEWRGLAVRARCHQAGGRVGAARDDLLEALALVDSMGHPGPADEIRESLHFLDTETQAAGPRNCVALGS